MKTHVKDLTINELKVLINATVEHSLSDYLEDLKALSSPGYIKSIAKAREDYRTRQAEKEILEGKVHGPFRDGKELLKHLKKRAI